MRGILLIVLAFFCLSAMPLLAGANAQYQQVSGLIDIRSTFSDGKHDLEYLVKLAKERGFDAIFINDHDRVAMEYGLFPWRNLIRKRIDKPSVNLGGAENYLAAIADVGRKYTDMLILPGVEAAPFYYWTGNPFSEEGLTANDWERHLLVMGLPTAQDYATLPDIHNNYQPPQPTGKRFGIVAIFALVAIFGLIIVKWSGAFTYIGGALTLVGTLFALDSLPFFSAPLFDQYHGPQGIAPYQSVIDYVNDKGGVTFWNHMETNSGRRKMNPIQISTPPYPAALEEAKSYTGFAAIYGDTTVMTEPGMWWDKILLGYCRGERPRPIWGISTADYHEEGPGTKSLGYYQTVFLVQERSAAAILAALKVGKMYAAQGSYEKRPILSQFTVSDTASDSVGVSGDEIQLTGQAQVDIRLDNADQQPYAVKVRLIRGGQPIETFNGKTSMVIHYKDNAATSEGKTYYRIDVKGEMGQIVSNPIFVSRP